MTVDCDLPASHCFIIDNYWEQANTQIVCKYIHVTSLSIFPSDPSVWPSLFWSLGRNQRWKKRGRGSRTSNVLWKKLSVQATCFYVHQDQEGVVTDLFSEKTIKSYKIATLGCPKKCINWMLLEPWCAGPITSGWYHLGLESVFWSIFTKTKQEQAPPSHVYGKI